MSRAELGQRLLELAVLEGDGGLVGEGLEEAQVVVLELRALGQPVGDRQRADRGRLAAERRDHRPLDQQGPAAGRLVGRREERPPGRDRPLDVGLLGDRSTGTITSLRPSCERSRPEDLVRVGTRVEDDLGQLGPEHLPGVVEQGEQSHVELRRVLEDPAGAVEHLEPLVLLALGDVRPVGEEEGDQGQGQEPDAARVVPQDRHRQEGQARVGDRHEAAELDHLGQLPELRRAARQGDRASQCRAPRSRWPGASPRRPPPSRAAAAARRGRPIERKMHDRGDGHDHVVGQVERRTSRPTGARRSGARRRYPTTSGQQVHRPAARRRAR